MDEFVDDRNPSPGGDPPVTAVASRRVKQGREREFEEWVSGILAAANRFPGYLGSEVLRPSDPEDNEYKIIFDSTTQATCTPGRPLKNVSAGFASPGPSWTKRRRSTYSPASKPGSRYPQSLENRHHLATRWLSSLGSRSSPSWLSSSPSL